MNNERTYKGKVRERKREILKKYLTSSERVYFVNIATKVTAVIFDKMTEKGTVETNVKLEDYLRDARTDNYSFIKERLQRVEKHEELYFFIYETVCRHISEAIAESKTWER
jgi:hypothetical protein